MRDHASLGLICNIFVQLCENWKVSCFDENNGHEKIVQVMDEILNHVTHNLAN